MLADFSDWLQALLKFNSEVRSGVLRTESFMGKHSRDNKDPSTGSNTKDSANKKKAKLKVEAVKQVIKPKMQSKSTVAFRDDKKSATHNCTYCGKPKEWHADSQKKHGGKINNIELCCIWANGHHNTEDMEFFKSAVGKKWAALGKKNLAL